MQQLVAGWRGAERSQPLSVLHDECLNAAGPGGRHLLPAYLLPVQDLDEANLRAALRKANGRVRGTDVRFRVRVAGRFDAVLVPFGPSGELPERWLLAINARSAYPPRMGGEGEKQVLRGLWFESGEQMWLWLDRQHDRLYGPDLMHQLEWLEAGDVLRVEWRPDVIVLRRAGHNDEIQREELRLVDPQELKALRGGLGESYRQSLQSILSAAPDGLTFAQAVTALRERQGHDVHQGTVRTLLYAGGFLHRNGCWFAAPQSDSGACRFRTALLESLMSDEQTEPTQEPMTKIEQQRRKVRAISGRLAEVIQELRGRM